VIRGGGRPPPSVRAQTLWPHRVAERRYSLPRQQAGLAYFDAKPGAPTGNATAAIPMPQSVGSGSSVTLVTTVFLQACSRSCWQAAHAKACWDSFAANRHL